MVGFACAPRVLRLPGLKRSHGRVGVREREAGERKARKTEREGEGERGQDSAGRAASRTTKWKRERAQKAWRGHGKKVRH